MEKKKTIIILTSLVTVLAVSAVAIVTISSSNKSFLSKTPYEQYLETHPDYNKTEAEWINDLINDNLTKKEYFTVNFDSDGGSSVPSQSVLKGEKVNQPENPTKLGYSFVDWVYKGSPWVFYGFSVTSNITIHASWSINEYSISYNLNGGQLEDEKTNPAKYTVNDEFSFVNPIRNGYSFAGWYKETQKVSKVERGTTGDLKLEAKWTPLKNQLSITSDDENKGTVAIVSGSGYSGESICVAASTTNPYKFKGWYNIENDLVSKDNPYTFEMPDQNYLLIGKFDELRTLSIDFSDSRGSVSGAGEYIIGDEVAVICNVNEGRFKGWFDCDNNLVSEFSEYHFEMPSENYMLKAKIMSDEEVLIDDWELLHGVKPVINEEEKTVTYGMYPNTHIGDSELIANLDACTEVYCGYTLYNNNLYYKSCAKPADLGNDAYGEKVQAEFDDGGLIKSDQEYWYSVTPIEWNILEAKEHTYKLVAKDLVDAHVYNNSATPFGPEPSTIYPNNYKYSSIRDWLNNDFLFKAFGSNDSYLKQVEIDNSPLSTNKKENKYCCENTFDKVTLLSQADFTNVNYGFSQYYFSCDLNRVARTTDFSRASGVWYIDSPLYLFNGYALSRSPNDTNYFGSARVSYGGGINLSSIVTEVGGVRPSITLSLK